MGRGSWRSTMVACLPGTKVSARSGDSWSGLRSPDRVRSTIAPSTLALRVIAIVERRCSAEMESDIHSAS